MKLHDPRTAAALTAIFDRTGTLFQGNAPEELVTLCRELERENAKLCAALAEVQERVRARGPGFDTDEIIARALEKS